MIVFWFVGENFGRFVQNASLILDNIFAQSKTKRSLDFKAETSMHALETWYVWSIHARCASLIVWFSKNCEPEQKDQSLTVRFVTEKYQNNY